MKIKPTPFLEEFMEQIEYACYGDMPFDAARTIGIAFALVCLKACGDNVKEAQVR